MRAMKTYAKKNEHVNAPIGPFTTFSHCAYGYNIRKELVYSRRDEMHRRSSAPEGRFGVAEPEGCASICEGAENQYDDLDRLSSDGGVSYTYDVAGNRTTKTENGETITYSLGVGDRLASWTDGAYSYDAAGCVTRIERNGKPTLDLTWNGLYHLVSVSTNGVFAEGYAYDVLGLVPKQNMDRYDFVVRTSKEIDAKIITHMR